MGGRFFLSLVHIIKVEKFSTAFLIFPYFAFVHCVFRIFHNFFFHHSTTLLLCWQRLDASHCFPFFKKKEVKIRDICTKWRKKEEGPQNYS